MELIFHSLFMPKLLLSKSQKGWPFFKRLLVELLRFLEPYVHDYYFFYIPRNNSNTVTCCVRVMVMWR